jgi:hypothetical protein
MKKRKTLFTSSTPDFRQRLVWWLAEHTGEISPEIKNYSRGRLCWVSDELATEKAWQRLEEERSGAVASGPGVLLPDLTCAEFLPASPQSGGTRLVYGDLYRGDLALARQDRVLAQPPNHMYIRRKLERW